MVVPARADDGSVPSEEQSRGKVAGIAQAFELITALQKQPFLNGTGPSKAPPPKPAGTPARKQRMPEPPSPRPIKNLKPGEADAAASSGQPPVPPTPKQPPSHPPNQAQQFYVGEPEVVVEAGKSRCPAKGSSRRGTGKRAD